MSAVISCVLLVALAVPAGAQEIFSWFNRGLLQTEFEVGDWARYSVRKLDENGIVADTLVVAVAAVDSELVWLRLDSGELEQRDWFAIRQDDLTPGVGVLDALVRVVRESPGGLADEDLDDLRESAVARRHFSDPFENPVVERRALADTLVSGVRVSREFVQLSEERRQAAGPFTIVTRLRSRARISPDLPLLGLLWSTTTSEVETEASGKSRHRRKPAPLFSETELRCLEFGRDLEIALPAGILAGN